MMFKAFALLGTLALVAGCGDDSEQDTGQATHDQADASTGTTDTQSGDSTDADETDSSSSDDTNADSGAQPVTSDATDEVHIPDPVLEDLPPDTELSELDDDELAEVCESYKRTATELVANLDDLCPVRGVNAAVELDNPTTDDVRAACSEEVQSCQVEATIAQSAVLELACESASDCSATLEDFNACNRQIAITNQQVIQPLGDVDVPSCEELTPTLADTTAGLVFLQLLLSLGQATEEAGGSPTDEDGPCQRITDQCPDLGLPLGGLSDLALPAP